MGWVLMIAGGVAVVTPGMVDPFAPINGLTIIGLVLVVAGTMRLTRGRV
jgi:hypothetical protein